MIPFEKGSEGELKAEDVDSEEKSPPRYQNEMFFRENISNSDGKEPDLEGQIVSKIRVAK